MEISKHLENWRPVKAIRAKCLDCSSGSTEEVKNCRVVSCPLYEYRFGSKKKSRFATPATCEQINLSETEDEDFIEEDL